MLYLILIFIPISLLFIGNHLKIFDSVNLFRKTKSTKRSKVDSNQFKYEPITYEQFALVSDRVKSKLIKTGEASRTVSHLEKMDCMVKRILEQGDKRCCGQIKANGYFSFAKIIFRYLECFDRDLATNKQPSSDLLEYIVTFLDEVDSMLKRLIQILEDTDLEDEQKRLELENELLRHPEFQRHLKVYRPVMVTKQTSDDDLINNNSINDDINNNNINNRMNYKNSFSTTAINQEFNSLPLISASYSTACDNIYKSIAQPEREVFFRRYSACWLDAGLIKLSKIFYVILLMLRNRIYRYPRLMLSSRARSTSLREIGRFVLWPHLNLHFKV